VSIGVSSPESHPGQTVLSVLEETREVLAVAIMRGGNSVVGSQSLLDEEDFAIPSAPSLPEIEEKVEEKREPIGVQEALDLIALGQGEIVKPQLAELMEKIEPLLKLSESGNVKQFFKKKTRKKG